MFYSCNFIFTAGLYAGTVVLHMTAAWPCGQPDSNIGGKLTMLSLIIGRIR